MNRIFSPYRICPLGAHIDHQGGIVLGRTIMLGTTLAYAPLLTKEIHIISDQFGKTNFWIGAAIDRTHWARYAQAAGRVLNAQLRRGMTAHVSGTLIGAGLSSSASVGLAFLKALAEVNDLEYSREQLVQWDYALESTQLGLQNGILDPMTIVHGQRDALLLIDTRTGSVTPITDHSPQETAWVTAYSGLSRELTKSGFNQRVAECREAAMLLNSGANILSDVPRELFEARKMTLPTPLQNRAAHYFGEVERVRQGALAWANGNFETFGQLMNESCDSSIRLYEAGSEILIQLQEIVCQTRGVFGSRFSGGGYGGCVVALVVRETAHRVVQEIAEKFLALHPELPSKVFVVEMGDGLSLRRTEED